MLDRSNWAGRFAAMPTVPSIHAFGVLAFPIVTLKLAAFCAPAFQPFEKLSRNSNRFAEGLAIAIYIGADSLG